MCRFLSRRSETDLVWMMRGSRLRSHTAREHQNSWHHVLCTDQSRFTLRSCDRWERVCEELTPTQGNPTSYPFSESLVA